MPVRSIGVSDSISLDNGTISSLAAHSFVMLVYPTTLAANKDYLVARATAVTLAGMFTGPGGSESSIDDGADVGDSIAAIGATINQWQWLGVSKGSGNTAARIHRCVLGGTWSHSPATGSYTTAATALTDLILGAADGAGSAVEMQIAVMGLFVRNVSDTAFEGFVNKTSDIFNALGGTPAEIWQFNQASTATAVVGLRGTGADQTALSGTTVVTGNDPSGFTFDGLGSSGDATVTSPPADGTGAIPVPGVGGGANVTAPVVDGTGAVPAPVVGGSTPDATVVVPVLDGTGALVSPAATISEEVIPGPASATGGIPAPTVAGNSVVPATVTAPPADATGGVVAPVLSGDAAVVAPPADGTGDVASPVVAGDSGVVGGARGGMMLLGVG